MHSTETDLARHERIPGSLMHPGALQFWAVILLLGIGTGLGAALLTRLLMLVQGLFWPDPSASLLAAAQHASAWHHVWVLLAAGLLTALAQVLLVRLTTGNAIDLTAAIWFQAGRLPTLRTVGSAVLSVILVGMGVSLGREGAPKQVGAVLANLLAETTRMSDEKRRLLVACGAGAGMAAAYGVPLGGALFSLEVLRGALSLRMVLPALMTALTASAVAWLALPNLPTYLIPADLNAPAIMLWALLAGPLIGLISVIYVKLIAWADRHKPTAWRRLVVPVVVLGALGALSIPFPELLGNGKDIAQLCFAGTVTPWLVLMLVFLRPLATVASLACGAPGGLFTPSLALGALFGALLGQAWAVFLPALPSGLCALIGAGAVLAATTQGPVSAVVLMMELTGHDRSFVAPLLLAVVLATVVARTVEPRSIYEARLTEDQVAKRREMRDH